ncbi:MAG TPA: Dickkopf N-terminal cysteine-rich domain-containing protein [Kofleriaceae bacterium]|nr:Dickkopf N-terminal cysteine-rich domain-containing protein [Kofleriaceae bacterium]
MPLCDRTFSQLSSFICVLACVCVALWGCNHIDKLSADGGDIDGPPVVDSGTPDAGPDAPPADVCAADTIDIGDIPDCYRQAVCDHLIACEGTFTDTDSCLDAVSASGELSNDAFFEAMEAAIDAGEVYLDQAALKTCFASLSQCGEVGVEACDRVFSGDDTGADPCFYDEECVPGGRCDNHNANQMCTAATCIDPVGLGDPCEFDATGAPLGDCKPGDQCVDIGSGRICTAGDDGDTCNGSFDCDPEMYCADGICRPDKGPNATCDDDAACAGDALCVGNGFMPVTGICQRPDAAGDKCDGQCYGALYCKGVTEAVAGTCQPLPVESESCQESGRCAPGLFCNPNLTCLPQVPEDGTCFSPEECEPGLFCEVPAGSAGTCVALRDLGEACTADDACESHLCLDQECAEQTLCY